MNRKLFVLLVFLSILLSACGPSETPIPTPTPTANLTPQFISTKTVDQCLDKQRLEGVVYSPDNDLMYFQISQRVPEVIANGLMAELYDGKWEKTSYTDIASIAGYCSSLDRGFYQVIDRTVDGNWEFAIVVFEANGKKVGTYRAVKWIEDTDSFENIQWEPGV